MVNRLFLWILFCLYSVFGFCQTHCISVEPLKKFNSEERHSYQPTGCLSKEYINLWELNNAKELNTALLKKEGFSSSLYGEKMQECYFISELKNDNLNGTKRNNDHLLYFPYSENNMPVWVGDTLFFRMMDEQVGASGLPPMLMSQMTDSHMAHMFGMLHVNLSDTEMSEVSKIVFETDTSHAIAGFFYVLQGDYEKCKVLDPVYQLSVKLNTSSTSDQIIDSLTVGLQSLGVPEFGNSPINVKDVKIINQLSSILNNLGIPHSISNTFTNLNDVKEYVDNVGFPLLVVPSYVNYGAAMTISNNENELYSFLNTATEISEKNPVVIFKLYTRTYDKKSEAVNDKARIYNSNLKHLELTDTQSQSIDTAMVYGIYIPMPVNKYPSLMVTLYKGDDEISSYNLSNIEIRRGRVTEIPLKKDSIPKKCDFPKIEYFVVGGNDKNGPMYEEIIYDNPSPVSAFLDFYGVTSIRYARLSSYNFLPYRCVGVNTYYKHARELKDQTSVIWKDVELYPGYNSFYGAAIVKNDCRNAKFLPTKERVIKLFLETKTCCFDYHEFARYDSLCGYIPKWNPTKWGEPMTMFEWEFHPKEGLKYGELPIKDVIFNDIPAKMNISNDNHFKGNLSLYWSAFTRTFKEGLHLVEHGIVEYRAATIYSMLYDTHYERAKESKFFTTDIIGLQDEYKKNVDGSLTFTGFFKEDDVKQLCEGIDFSSSYFDGYERGVILLDTLAYGNVKFPEKDFRKNMHPSRSVSGQEFKCTVNKLNPKGIYKVWAYLVVEDKLFLSDGRLLVKSIFGNLPQRIKSYLTKTNNVNSAVNNTSNWDILKARADDYVKSRFELEKTSGIPMWKKYEEKQKLLVDEYKNIAEGLGLQEDDPSQEGESVLFKTEGNLPYSVISVKKKGVLLPPYMFNEMYAEKSEDRAIRLFAEGVSIIKQSPLVLMELVELNIKLTRKVTNDLLPIYAYVPGNGPDGKRLGSVFLYPLMGKITTIPGMSQVVVKNFKIGDVISLPVLIYGWGTPEILDQMKSLVFTSVDHDSGRRSNKITVQGIRRFPVNPMVDWMDNWYGVDYNLLKK